MSKKSPNIPRHVAIILDGNRRWAKKRGLQPWKGHLVGIGDQAQDVIRAAFDLGVDYLTLWAGSYDNLTKRSKTEIKMLNEAYRRFAQRILNDEEIKKRDIMVKFVGEWEKVLEKKTVDLLKKVESHTKNHKGPTLTPLIAYNGDRELLEAVSKLKRGRKISAAELKETLWTKDYPQVDFIIRTGVDGDPHNSAGFMMWLTRDSQLYFSKKLWPDFTKEDLKKAIKDYESRERRLGK